MSRLRDHRPALGVTGHFLEYHYGPHGTPLNISMIPNVKLPLIQHVGFFGTAVGDANLMTWIGLACPPRSVAPTRRSAS